ncbi:MAG: TM2 domain-containing protein [Bacteroidia bacterium]
MIFASCSTTIERNATAFGSGWGMKSSKESYKSKPSQEKKETPRNSAQIGKKSTELIIRNSQRNEVIPEKQLKAEDLFKTKEFKNLNFVQKAIVKKAVKKIKKKQVKSKKNAPYQSVISDTAQGSGRALSSKERIIAILLSLCVFLGVGGLHRFYLGYDTIGVIQLVTPLACAAWFVIEVIEFLAYGTAISYTPWLIYVGILVWVLIDLIRLIFGNLGRAGGSASNGAPKID